MGTKTKILGLIMAVMALSAPIIWADSGNSEGDKANQGGEWHHAHHGQMTAKILNLSDDQVKQLKDIHQKQKEAMKNVFEQMKSNREALETEIVKATPDMNKVNGIEAQIKTLQAQMVDNNLNKLLEIKKVMTTEQFAGWMALEKEEDMMKHDGHNKFGHKEGACKLGDGHKHWGDKSDKDQDND
jgi:Spy/CpxP family protein refolding chaperone